MKPSAKEQTIPSVVLKRIIPAKRADVFDAWTKPELMGKWFLPSTKWTTKTSVDLRVGGKYSHEMIDPEGSGKPGGQKNAPGTCNDHTGEYLEIKRPERLVFTWNTRSVQNTRVTVEFRDLGDQTELTLTHELLPDEHRQPHAEGWKMCLDNLDAYIGK